MSDSLLNPDPNTDPNVDPNVDPNANPNIDPAPTEPNAAAFNMEQFMSDGWKDCIPEDLRNRSEWERVNNVQDVFKNYINAQQTISKSVRIPDATSTAEELTAFYTKLGKPASAAEYDFEYEKQEDAIFGKDSFDFSEFKDIADKANLTKSQFQALASAYIDAQNKNYKTYNTNIAEAAGAELREAEATLRKEWGKNYATNINNISSKLNNMYSEDTIKKMSDSGLFRDVNFLKNQLALTKMMTGDTIYIEGRSIEDVPQTISDLRAKRDSLMNADYVGNKQQVDDLNKQIVSIQMAQNGQLSRNMR